MLTRMTAHPAASLAHTRVSTLLERSPEVLLCLVRHGFAPLQNPVMRGALAATVTLEQAVRIRGLSQTQARALYAELEEILTCP